MSEYTEYHFVRCREPLALAEALTAAGVSGELLLEGRGIDDWRDPGPPGAWVVLVTPDDEIRFGPVAGPWVGLYKDEGAISWRLTAGRGGSPEIDLYFTDPDDAQDFEEEAPDMAAAIRRAAAPPPDSIDLLEQILEKSRDLWRAHLDEFTMQKFLDANGMPYYDILDRHLVDTGGGVVLVWSDAGASSAYGG